jgi:hypothetical protein
MRKVLFLDIDGVCNSAQTINRSHRGVIGIDPYMAFLVGKITLDTGCEVVLSSSWRHSKTGREEVEQAVVPCIDITPTGDDGFRGKEIKAWLDAHPDVTHYAILDDDSDMLPTQLPHFFQTSWETGLTEEIAQAVTRHLSTGITTIPTRAS